MEVIDDKILADQDGTFHLAENRNFSLCCYMPP